MDIAKMQETLARAQVIENASQIQIRIPGHRRLMRDCSRRGLFTFWAIDASMGSTKHSTNIIMITTEAKIKAAKKLTYRVSTDELFADGKLVGGASDLTRDLMLARADESWHNDDDETLFDALVTTISTPCP